VTENIFDRLADLLRSAGPVNWALATQIAESVAGPAEPIDPWVAEEYQELGRTAALLISRAGVLDTADLPPLQVTDPRQWAAANIRAYAYLAEPLAAVIGAGGEAAPPGLEQVFGQMGPALVGLQVGTVVGAAARGVHGPFDAGLPPFAPAAGPELIAPNVEAFAGRSGLEQRRVRLWAALRETAHQAQMRLPWVRDHLGRLVAAFVSGLEFRPDLLQERLQDLQDPEALESMMSEPGGIGGLSAFRSAEGPAGDDLAAALAFLSGHGRVVAAEAAGSLLPDFEAIEEAAAGDRAEGGPGSALHQILGLEEARSLAGDAARFSAEIGRRWGSDARRILWQGPDSLPTVSEILDPVGWAARVMLPNDL
jgi:putative hydrolase